MLEQVRDKKNPRRASDTARKKSEIEFRRLLEKLPAGAYTCDPEGLITYYNQHAVRVWGRAPKLNDPVDRFCGSFKLFAPDGAPIAHDTGLLVAVTGYGFDQDRQRSIQAGFDRHLVKPVLGDALRRLLSDIQTTGVESGPAN